MYKINKLNEITYYIDDEFGDSLYLLIGKSKALLIDTGMSKEPLLPLLRKYTNLPIEVVLTHAHIDHMYHVDEFETIYLHENEKKHWKWALWLCVFAGSLMYKVKHKHYPIKKMQTVNEDDIFDLGHRTIKVVNAFGHTPGSIMLVDEDNKMIFAGDAIGSGQFSWMWLPGSLKVKDYQKSLQHLKEKLKNYSDFTIYGGHHQQAFQNEGQPLTLKTIDDFIQLCALVQENKLTANSEEKIMGTKIYTYRYEKAAFVIRK